MKYIIRADRPYAGSIQSILKPDGTVGYTNGQSLADYEKECGFPLKVIDEKALDALTEGYLQSLITDPVEETPKAFEDALCVLPPCKWQKVAGVEMFHLSERLTHDLVHWHTKLNGRCFAFTDRETLSADAIASKAAKAAERTMEPA